MPHRKPETNRAKTGGHPAIGGASTAKLPHLQGFSSIGAADIPGGAKGRKPLAKCKVLLHLGNQVAFFVDNEKCAGIRFWYSILPGQSSASPL